MKDFKALKIFISRLFYYPLKLIDTLSFSNTDSNTMIKQLKPMLLQALRVLCYKAFIAFYISKMTGDSALNSKAFLYPKHSYPIL